VSRGEGKLAVRAKHEGWGRGDGPPIEQNSRKFQWSSQHFVSCFLVFVNALS
jgi:hypothetical protein